MTGYIKSVKTDKGYGFIRADDQGADLFFHRSELDLSLEFCEQLTERRVRFESVTKNGRERAINVRSMD